MAFPPLGKSLCVAAAAVLGASVVMYGVSALLGTSSGGAELVLRSESGASSAGLALADLRALSMTEMQMVMEYVAAGGVSINARVALQPPLHAAVGIVLAFHGCGGNVDAFFERPEERLFAAKVAEAQLLLISLGSSASRTSDTRKGCWTESDLAPTLAFVSRLRSSVEVVAGSPGTGRPSPLQKARSAAGHVPLFGVGMSSGSRFLGGLAAELQFDALVLHVGHVATEVLDRMTQDGHVPPSDRAVADGASASSVLYPPTLHIAMPRDARLSSNMHEVAATLEYNHVSSDVLECPPSEFSTADCIKLLPWMEVAACAAMTSRLARAGLLSTDTGALLQNPHDAVWQEEVDKGVDVYASWRSKNAVGAAWSDLPRCSASAQSTLYVDGVAVVTQASASDNVEVAKQEELSCLGRAFYHALNARYAQHEFCANNADAEVAHFRKYMPAV